MSLRDNIVNRLILRTPVSLVVVATHFTVQPVVGLGLPTEWQLRLVAVLMSFSVMSCLLSMVA